MTSAPIFSMKGVGYTYPGAPVPALRELHLEVERGEWLALIGANGSGKSTLAKLCNALLLPSQGDCFVLGMSSREPENLRKIRASVALVFQNPEDQIVASIVEEDVAFGPENQGVSSSEIRVRVDRALALTGLTDYRRHGSYSLSGGQKQRLALAGALALEPEVILLDESTSMLDPEGREAFLACLGELNRQGLSIVQITHRMEEAVQAGRIAVMEAGNLVWDGTPTDFFRGEYLRWNFEEPPEIALYRELRAHALLVRECLPDIDAMLDNLCLSS